MFGVEVKLINTKHISEELVTATKFLLQYYRKIGVGRKDRGTTN